MKIQGVVDVEGVRLHVDVEAPDDGKDIYVTNIHPNCLVVPKERWSVHYLGLSKAALDELAQKKVRNLGQLVNGQWKLSRNGFSEQATQEITDALEKFRNMALLFEQPCFEDIAQAVEGFPISEIEQGERPIRKRDHSAKEESGAKKGHLDTPVRQLMISQRMQDALIVVRNARTLGDVLALGKGKIAMTPTVTAKDVVQLEKEIARLGHALPNFAQQEATDGKSQ